MYYKDNNNTLVRHQYIYRRYSAVSATVNWSLGSLIALPCQTNSIKAKAKAKAKTEAVLVSQIMLLLIPPHQGCMVVVLLQVDGCKYCMYKN